MQTLNQQKPSENELAYYEEELKKLNLQTQMPFEEKAFYIRKLRSKIAQLKRLLNADNT